MHYQIAGSGLACRWAAIADALDSTSEESGDIRDGLGALSTAWRMIDRNA